MTDTILAVAYSLASASTMGLFGVLVRRAESRANAVTGVLIGIVVSLPFLAASTAYLWEPGWWNLRALVLFAAAGAINPAVGRVFLFLSIHRLGVARAVPLISALPLATAGLGIAFLGERPGLIILAGTLLVAAGCMAITSRRGMEGKWDRKFLWMPFAAVAAFSVAHLWQKMGLALVPSPILGLTVMSLAGAACLFLFGGFLPRAHRPVLGSGAAWVVLGLTGLLNTLSILFYFSALRYGDLTIVAPLFSTAPFFSLLLSWAFLRDLERVTPRMVSGTVLVVLGGVLITWRVL
ncbi:MAG: DMT family transporter [Candidatus Tectomicrobia bacterium]|nr:DMT family transporter [Candidatus Tectomicrobia bacterium]